MTIEVDITGRRYLEDRDTDGGPGRQQDPRHQLHRALDAERSTGTQQQPWRITAVGAPVGLA